MNVNVEATPSRTSGGKRLTPGVVLGAIIHSVLTHPLMMAVKAPVKDVMWTVRGRGLRNPPFGRDVQSALFLCHGNICRSPFAAERAAQLLERAGIRIRCASAGIAANQAKQCPAEARLAAQAFGLNLDEHTPTLLTAAMIDEFDLVVVMEAGQMQLLRERFPGAASRLVLLPLVDATDRHGYARYNIADPFGQPRAAFDDCYRRIDRALHSLLRLLTPDGSQSTADAPIGTR